MQDKSYDLVSEYPQLATSGPLAVASTQQFHNTGVPGIGHIARIAYIETLTPGQEIEKGCFVYVTSTHLNANELQCSLAAFVVTLCAC